MNNALRIAGSGRHRGGAPPPPAGPVFVAATEVLGPAWSTSPFSTSAIDTTGANFLVACLGSFDSNWTALLTITDSYGNTWHRVDPPGSSVGIAWGPTNYHAIQMFYAYNATCGPGHIFTMTAGNPDGNGALAVAAFSGMPTSDPYEGTIQFYASGSIPVNPCAPTTGPSPAAVGDLIICAAGTNSTGLTAAIDAGGTIVAQVWGGQSGASIAYIVATSTAAINPGWSDMGTQDVFACVAIFAG